MPMLIMLSLYIGLFICTLLYLRKTNRIKFRVKTKQKTILKGHGKSHVKDKIRRK